ncbi:AraC family transcriptional regulator [Massilia sp. Root133]|jgi:LacI family transcriptional regulator|uniref:Helix-turn-helix domain-containing protein n=1 Tax=Massilia cellulosiltytica TaxID=2683234 RepID=A0A7X3FYN9_9BURK|nr:MULTISPECIES: DNA-binding transcriptional regulator [Telluria group]KQY11933.1 AraC family transcriptional regulator [Massilia sp. Root133]KQZ34482.1 AraC family transcriptional regulator [Massilia sp. Root1485]MVW60489.1 helix-turn-helix domain-containing protein [Telluria cellulosilytica]
MKCPKTHRIALLFDANQAFAREVIGGIAGYLSSRRTSWELFIEDDFRLRLSSLARWQGDGIIAHFDDPAVAAALADSPVPVVAVGGSYANEADYPANVPYVATDNFKLVNLAYTHLIDVGLRRFALFSLPDGTKHPWALEREKAFRFLMQRDKFDVEILRGEGARSWEEDVAQQVRWLQSLPKPIGIIAATDARARQLLQACQFANIAVPEQVAIIGIDNDPLARMLSCIPLSSVIQGSNEIGRTAARMLHQLLEGTYLECSRILVPPAGINVLASSSHQPVKNPRVMRARHFIRQYACQGIKGDQVADYVGVSRSTLETYFQQELACSVHDEILRFKLDAATALLAEGDCSVAEVAQRCGFTSMQYLFAVFKRELGCSPREYQQRVALAQAIPQEVALQA